MKIYDFALFEKREYKYYEIESYFSFGVKPIMLLSALLQLWTEYYLKSSDLSALWWADH